MNTQVRYVTVTISILKNIIIFFVLYCFGITVSCAQEVDKKNKYIHPIIESDSVFQSSILFQEYVVVDFWAIWCKPCQLFLTEYAEIAKKCHKKAAFYKLNVDSCTNTAQKYDAKMIPLIIIFKNGKEVKRYAGLTAKERIIFDLEEIIKSE